MQFQAYISEKDYATLSKNLPSGFKTVSSWASHLMRIKASELESAASLTNAAGEPIIPQYERQ